MEIEKCLTKDGKYKTTKKHHQLFFDQIREGNLEFVSAVLNASPAMVNVLGKNNSWYMDKSPLMYALQCAQDKMCTLLIDRGAEVDFVMPEGQEKSICNWAATMAAMYGESKPEFMQILKRLLELGANPNHRDYMGRDALHEAISQLNALGKCWQTVLVLIDAGADPEREHKKWLLQLAKVHTVKRYGEPASPSLLAPEIYEAYGITKDELEKAIKAGAN